MKIFAQFSWGWSIFSIRTELEASIEELSGCCEFEIIIGFRFPKASLANTVMEDPTKELPALFEC